MKILFADTTHPALPEQLAAAGFEIEQSRCKTKEECLAIIDQYEGVIIRSKFIIDEELLAKATKLKFIGRVGAGMENIDVNAAESRGIKCFNSPEGNRNAVGEHALGMLLALQNNLLRANVEVSRGQWRREANRGIELKNKTIGIVGFGNTGSAFAKKLSGMEMRILAFDKYKTNYAPDYVHETDLQTLFQECDIISFHIPLTDETLFMVDRDFLNAFHKPIVLINTSRGKIVKTRHLVDGLKNDKIKGACLDVLEYEAVSFEHLHKKALPEEFRYLCESDKVILSPHIAGWSHESNIKLSSVLAEKIIDAFA